MSGELIDLIQSANNLFLLIVLFFHITNDDRHR